MKQRNDSRGAGKRKGTGSNDVYESLRGRILTLQLAPGVHLDEATLVEAYGVSRTPVREALIRLGSSGLVVLLPNRGAKVAPIDLGNLREFFEALDLCQRAVTHWAALRRNEQDMEQIERARLAFEAAARNRSVDDMNDTNVDFHQAIARASGNVHFARSYESLLDEGLRVARVCLSYESDEDSSLQAHLDAIVDEHRQMEEMIREGDGPSAERIASDHARLFRNRITTSLAASLAPKINVAPVDG